MVKKVLFVCLANVIRSQMAEAFYNNLSKSKEGKSAGILYSSPLRFRKPHKYAIAVMKEAGIDISKKKVKQITLEMIDSVDQVYVMIHKEDCPYFLRECGKVKYWKIDDPLGGDLEDYQEARDKIKKKIESIL